MDDDAQHDAWVRENIVTPLGDLVFTSDWKVEPGASIRISNPAAAPYGEPEGNRASVFTVRPLFFGRFPEFVSCWTLDAITISGQQYLVPPIVGRESYPVPLSLFMRGDRSPIDLQLSTQVVSGQISITVTNVSQAPQDFWCTMIGRFAIHKDDLGPGGLAELKVPRADAPPQG